jgi:hypothetical protein
MPDRQVDGLRAVGEAESWAPSTTATVLRHGPFVLDQGALLGLDESARKCVIDYVVAFLDRLAANSRPPEFEQWFLKEGHTGSARCEGSGHIPQWFPSNFESVKAGVAPVPIKLYPSPSLVRSVVGQRMQSVGTDAPERLAEAGFRLGRTAVYELGALKPGYVEGKKNGERLFRLLPLATPAISRYITAVAPMSYAPQYGRLVVPNTPQAWAELAQAFTRGGKPGSQYFGEILTVEVLPEVFLRRVTDAKGQPENAPVLVFELWDGLQGFRCDAPPGFDPMAVRASVAGPGDGSNAKLGQHELFRSPLPVARGIAGSGVPRFEHPQERLVIDEAWAAAVPPIVVVRKGEKWEPYCESLVIDNHLGSTKVRDGSLLMLGVFSSSTPEQLVDTFAAFCDADANAVKSDAEFMAKLRGLFERANPKP